VTSVEALAWLYSTQQFGIKLGLDNTRALLALLGNPEKNLRFLHVAGTNGKGSVCAFLDSLCRAHALRTGLYTSPHLVEFGERIRVNGTMIPDEKVLDVLTLIRRETTEWPHPPTYFEIVTALGIRHFADEGCDIVILETGMGGRLDSTNAVTPLVSVITPVDFDHMKWLGDTLAAIATEKAGIIKPGVPVISGRQQTPAEEVLRVTALEKGAPIEFVNDPLEGYALGIPGSIQKLNAALALRTLTAAGISLTDAEIRAALKSAAWPGRFQVLADGTVLDGGHNPQAAECLVQHWIERFGDEKAVVVFGALSDKDYSQMLASIERISREFYFVPTRSQRAEAPVNFHVGVPSQIKESLSAGIAAARRSGDRVLITGSLFLVGEAMELLGVQP